ncbi:MAG TPA: ABC transporter permease [Gaiellaceae bacterium]|nr:ABC transporter permease [Gaiellaceae bacterium]
MRAVLLVLAKDVRTLVRTPALLVVLVAYPVLIAALLGLVAGYASSKPRVAFVDEDGLPAHIVVGTHSFDVNATIDEVAKNVKLVRLGEAEAQRELSDGRVVAVVTVPPGFVATLQEMVRSPTLELAVTRGGTSSRVRQQVQALVYSLNTKLQRAYIAANLQYVKLILHGGNGSFLGDQFDVLGLDGTERMLRSLPQDERVQKIEHFVHDARLALAETDNALRATAAPITLVEVPQRGRSASLSAQVESYALALTITFLSLVLAAGALAGERDENVLGRLARGLVGPGRLVAAKVALAALVATALGLGVAFVFAIAIVVGNAPGGEPWQRLPLLAVGLALTGAALGALGALVGALAREARTASLAAVLLVLPVVFLGLIPAEVFAAAGWASDALPFAHGVRLFTATLYDLHPWGAVGREAAWLAGLTIVFALLARAAVRPFRP